VSARLWTSCLLPGLAAFACVTTGAAVAKPGNRISGIYSNVHLSPETGDLGGLEIEFHAQGPKPHALVVFCEGWCNQWHRVPVELRGDKFSLSFSETLRDSSGSKVGEDHYRIEGRIARRSLIVHLRLNTNQWRMKLDPLRSRFGLDVAHPPTKREAAVPQRPPHDR